VGRHLAEGRRRLSGVAALQVARTGEFARRALARGGGVARPLGACGSEYFQSGGEVLWIGSGMPAMHPRAVVTREPAPRGVPLRLIAVPSPGWSRQRYVPVRAARFRLRETAPQLRTAILASAQPRGFGVVLAGRVPASPFAAAAGRVRALARAYAGDDPRAVLQASLPLIGLGSGLTPSGDDVAGAALFGRCVVAPRDARWRALGARLAREVRQRSHPVSAALFADLARGQSFEPLHAMAEALAAGESGAALEAARGLVAIGHSSGWDMLAGFYAGALGQLA
jgi:hypothetical protein